MEKQEALENLKNALEEVVNNDYGDDALYNEILDKADDLLEILDCYNKPAGKPTVLTVG